MTPCLNDFEFNMLLLGMVLESQDMSQEAEKVSELLRHDGKGNNGSEKITNCMPAPTPNP